jgi:O-antigen/teichoic acid export membrane protein
MLKKIKSFLFENKTISQTVAKNTFWLSVSNILGKILRAIIIIYVARVLGAESWGIFSYALTIASTLTIIMDFGTNPIVLRELSKEKNDDISKKLLNTAFVLKLILLILGILIIIFFVPKVIKIKEAVSLLPLAAFVLAFDILRDFTFTISRAKQMMEKEAFLFTLTNLAIVIFGFIFLKISPNIYSFALAYVFGTGFGTLITLFYFRKYFEGFYKYFSPNLIKTILFSAWPFALSGILSMFLTNTDILIIGWFKSASDVGIYSAALRIIQLLYIIPGILTLSLLPVFSNLAYKDNEKFRKILEQGMKILFLIALPLTIGGLTLSYPIMKFVFGNEYIPGASSFAVLALTIAVDFNAVILMNAIFAYNKQKYLSIYTGIGAFLNVLLDLILIPRFGILGSAWATFFAQLISNIYLWQQMKKINYFQVLPHIKKPIFASILMGILAYILNLISIPVILNIFIAGTFYFAILYAIKEPAFQEIKNIISLNLK